MISTFRRDCNPRLTSLLSIVVATRAVCELRKQPQYFSLDVPKISLILPLKCHTTRRITNKEELVAHNTLRKHLSRSCGVKKHLGRRYAISLLSEYVLLGLEASFATIRRKAPRCYSLESSP